ncbi:MAG: hypothetical protein ACO3UU_16580, partial [Minisyncoccia bacterium]
MAINAWKTNLIGLGIPAKVVPGTADSVINKDLWPYSYGASDQYHSTGSQAKPYRFEITFSIPDYSHASHLSRIPFIYNAQDIEVGDFVAGADDGKVLQIISIISKTNGTLVAICEDILRYNAYKLVGPPTFNIPGSVVFFQLNEQGLPILDPVPNTVSTLFFANLASRFQYLNPLSNYLLEQANHGFSIGDAISIDSNTGLFVKADGSNIKKYIGTVTQNGPGPNLFLLRPNNGIIDFVPGLPGSPGDFLYANSSGNGTLTTDDSTERPLFIKISNAIPSETIGTGVNPSGNDGDVFELNKVQISMA